MTFARSTVLSEVKLSGVGLHSGIPVTVTIHPSESGIQFRHGQDTVDAHPKNVTDTSRCTRLGSISMVEHMMSALCSLEITDALIEVDAPELPGLDGSAKGYFEAIAGGGSQPVGEKTLPELFGRIFHQSESIKVAIGKGTGHWRFVYDRAPYWPELQTYESENICADFGDQIAPARTIVLESELPMIQAAGLGKGLDRDSVVIVGEAGYVNKARFHNEIARHKLLDLIGDLYLSGVPARMLNVVAERSGHAANIRCAAMLAEATAAR